MAVLSGFSSPELLLLPRSPSAAAATLCRGASDRARAFHGAQSSHRCGERASCGRRSGVLALGARAHGAQRSALGDAAAASALPSAAGGDAGLLSSRRRESRDVATAVAPSRQGVHQGWPTIHARPAPPASSSAAWRPRRATAIASLRAATQLGVAVACPSTRGSGALSCAPRHSYERMVQCAARSTEYCKIKEISSIARIADGLAEAAPAR
jgi:hypothetical protein